MRYWKSGAWIKQRLLSWTGGNPQRPQISSSLWRRQHFFLWTRLTWIVTKHCGGVGVVSRLQIRKVFFQVVTLDCFNGFKEIGERYGPFDLTMVETGAYNSLWADIHMFPEQSVQGASTCKVGDDANPQQYVWSFYARLARPNGSSSRDKQKSEMCKWWALWWVSVYFKTSTCSSMVETSIRIRACIQIDIAKPLSAKPSLYTKNATVLPTIRWRFCWHSGLFERASST